MVKDRSKIWIKVTPTCLDDKEGLVMQQKSLRMGHIGRLVMDLELLLGVNSGGSRERMLFKGN